jgi:CRP-like cAMP-binding protein
MTLTQKVFALKNIAPFDTLSDAELILSANIMYEKVYENGAVIYNANTPIHNLLIVINGEVHKGDSTVNSAPLGLDCVINDDIMDEDIVASGETTILYLSKPHLLTLLFECPALMFGFLSQKKGVNNEA